MICLPRMKSILFLGFLFQIDLLFEVVIVDDLVQSRTRPAGNRHLQLIASILNPSTESTISTSSIHNTVSEGKSVQEVIWVMMMEWRTCRLDVPISVVFAGLAMELMVDCIN